MSCVLAPKFIWCKDLPTVYKDEEGESYCLFHAPAGKKGVSADEFKKAVKDKITLECGEKSSFDLSGAVFEGELSFSEFDKDNPLCDAKFSKALFVDNVDFAHVTFDGKADFSGTVFKSNAYFSKALFKGVATFEGAVFDKDVIYDKAKFLEKAYFFDTNFNGWSSFKMVEFGAELYFSWGAFIGGGNFEKAKFGGRFIFKRRMLEGDQPEGEPKRGVRAGGSVSEKK